MALVYYQPSYTVLRKALLGTRMVGGSQVISTPLAAMSSSRGDVVSKCVCLSLCVSVVWSIHSI